MNEGGVKEEFLNESSSVNHHQDHGGVVHSTSYQHNNSSCKSIILSIPGAISDDLSGVAITPATKEHHSVGIQAHATIDKPESEQYSAPDPAVALTENEIDHHCKKTQLTYDQSFDGSFLNKVKQSPTFPYISWYRRKCFIILSTLKTRFLGELYITGEEICHAFTPAEPGRHSLLFTSSMVALWISLFFIMASQYDLYKIPTIPSAAIPCRRDSKGYGPSIVLRWMQPSRGQWCYENSDGVFDAKFLMTWGARWNPQLRHHPQLWITSGVIHMSFGHLVSNCILFIVLSSQMERQHGALRIASGWVISAFGGNLLRYCAFLLENPEFCSDTEEVHSFIHSLGFCSAVIEDSCTAVAGASGGIFGLVGMFLAETVLDWKAIRRKLFRLSMILCFSILFSVSSVLESKGTSQFSHLGGAIFGIILAIVLLPKSQLPMFLRMPSIIIGTAVLIVLMIALLLYFYKDIFPSIDRCEW